MRRSLELENNTKPTQRLAARHDARGDGRKALAQGGGVVFGPVYDVGDLPDAVVDSHDFAAEPLGLAGVLDEGDDLVHLLGGVCD